MQLPFVENITNEQVSGLPIGQFGGEIITVDSSSGIAEACDYLSRHSVIGFDTETRPSFKAGVTNKTALLQLSTMERCYLFRLCSIPLERDILRILENKSIVKVGADVKGDLRAMQQLRRFRPGAFTDLQNIVGEWGIKELSVRKMAAIVLGTRISKAQRLSNWESSELTAAQKLYAATDAWVCLEILNRLNRSPKI